MKCLDICSSWSGEKVNFQKSSISSAKVHLPHLRIYFATSSIFPSQLLILVIHYSIIKGNLKYLLQLRKKSPTSLLLGKLSLFLMLDGNPHDIVLCSIPSCYTVSSTVIPTPVTSSLDSIALAFWWGVTNSGSKGLCLKFWVQCVLLKAL